MLKKFALILTVLATVVVIFYMTNSLPYIPKTYMIQDNSKESAKYLVNSPKCKMLDLDPFDQQVRGFHQREIYIKCTGKQPLTYIQKTGNVSTLRINFEVVSDYSNDNNFSCCFKNINRQESRWSNDNYEFSSCQPFKDNVTLEEVSIRVYCTDSSKKTIYENTHASVIFKNQVYEKMKQIKNKDNVFNVLIIGIDSVSRLNFIRSLPKSYKFLMENQWISFKGYNKVADNTFPNIMAILTGYNREDSESICKPTVIEGLDNCSMIWYDYRKLGYATAYAEDQCDLSTFNLDRKGFKAAPTDYYFRPYLLASETTLKVKIYKGLRYCAGLETSGERVMSIAKDFATTFANDPSFSLFWMNTFSHNDLNLVSIMDDKIQQFLQDIVNNGVLEKTIVMFLSDHGIRIGDFRYSPMGWLEERLPFFFIWIPHKFRHKHPDLYTNIKQNADHKLTTPYDLYMTLQHILTLSGVDYTIKPSTACPKCKSLFLEIDDDRSCEDASIEQHWCTCSNFNAFVSNNQILIDALNYVLDQIHQIIRLSKGHYKCAEFSVNKIITASISTYFPEKKVQYILIVFQTDPKAVFEVTVTYSKDAPQRFKINGEISRVDRYDTHSSCVEKKLKKFCYCKNIF